MVEDMDTWPKNELPQLHAIAWEVGLPTRWQYHAVKSMLPRAYAKVQTEIKMKLAVYPKAITTLHIFYKKLN